MKNDDAPTTPDRPAGITEGLDLASRRASAPTPGAASWETFTPEQSKQILGYGFDAGGSLVVQFRRQAADGTVAYRYAEYPGDLAQKLATAESIGSAVGKLVRPITDFSRLSAVPPECVAAAVASTLAPPAKE